ncbi:MAG: nitrile hydratase accessory protein [Nakamurella sp.]
MSGTDIPLTYDDSGRVRFHDSCVTDLNQPTFDADWQRRAFGLAVALSEFKHYEWDDFQQQLIASIGNWQDAPDDARGRWEYYQHWVTALEAVVAEHGLLNDDYVNPEDREDDHEHQQARP